MGKHMRWMGLVAIVASTVVIISQIFSGAIGVAQTPASVPTPIESPVEAIPITPLPGSRTQPPPPSPSPAPSPTSIAIPLKSPAPTASPSATPLPVPAALPPVATPAAAPLPLDGEYQDPAGRFRVAKLKDYLLTPLGDSVLLEAKDGHLAYTVLVQPASVLGGATATPDTLGQLAKTAFQRGEGFQVVTQQTIGSNVQIDWTGSLTIAGKTQPVSGVIIGKATNNNLLFLMITATESGSKDVPGAIAALADSLQAL